MVELKPKFNMFGLCFDPIMHRQILKAPNLATPIKFSSANVSPGQVNVVNDYDSECDLDKWIRPSVPAWS